MPQWLRSTNRVSGEPGAVHGVRPLKLHTTRHTWATLALEAGKSVRWVADQLGHADPALTLRVYAHAMREEEPDLSFAEFGGSERLYPAPGGEAEDAELRNPATLLVGRQGLEPWTLGLKEQGGAELRRGLTPRARQIAA